MPFLGINLSRALGDTQLQRNVRVNQFQGRRRRTVRQDTNTNCLYSTGVLKNSTILGFLTKSPKTAIFINQALFFLLCDKVFLSARDKNITALYSLLFYSVGAYLISYGKELVDQGCFTVQVNVSEHSNVRHLALSATKLVLDIVKFVTFTVTVIFILLVFGVPGHRQFDPSWLYILTTVTYYALTDPWVADNGDKLIARLKLDVLDSLESLWTPVILRVTCSFLSAILVTLAWFGMQPSSFLLIMAAVYVNVYLCLQETTICWKTLIRENSSLDRYRYATSEEIAGKKDDVCSVCLTPMTWKTRVTSCGHLFHSDCLRLCLKMNYSQCPICKKLLL
ncbi:hypothetical protein HDE_02219 [Halotydeus destructor]|nr:hypothetical protein HDE_02219 [Halotydeus destructor]